LRGAWLEDLTWEEAGQRLQQDAVVVLPVGAAAKEHGPHLPLGTDRLVAKALAERVAAALPVLIAPILCFGYYPAFTHYAGSQHLSAPTFIALLTEILAKLVADGAQRIVIINTGVSTEAPIRIALRDILDRTGVRVAVADIARLGSRVRQEDRQKVGGHADALETSLMLAIAPELVHMERARTDYGHADAEPRTVFYRPVRFTPDPEAGPDYSATGARGDPTLADRASGLRLLEEMANELIAGIQALYPDVVGQAAD
jgi:creatinine amidohydrolase